MAAYSALLTLMHTIEQIQHHPRPPISLDKTQVQSLTENITFLQKFLESHPHEADRFESRIADAAREAEDMIESHVVDQILDGSKSGSGDRFDGSTSHQQNVDLFEGLKGVIDNMDKITEGALKNIEEGGLNAAQRQPDARPPNLQRPEHNIMVGLDEELEEIMGQLASDYSDRLILPIVGMAGIGKTTLAKNVYSNPFTLEHFDFRAWTTVSQEYSTLEILRDLHSQFNIKGRGDPGEKTVDKLGVGLHKFLFGRRYFIILDDIWSIAAWDNIRYYFPSNETGSRIIVTTRLLPVALGLSGSSYLLRMSLLDGHKSWELFCKTVFGEDGCPLTLREAAKKITEGCKGLPLSIVVIGGLLRKSDYKQDYWVHVAENFKTQLNLVDDELCSKILYMSYNQLPLHLKPCFLYMGVFPEDEVIHVSMLIKLWVAEGFLKPIQGKSMEHVAQEYIRDLIDRNLVIVQKLGSTDNIKYCNIHDLLRDLCLREAQAEGFFKVIKKPSPIPEKNNNNKNSVRIVLSERLSTDEDNYSASAKYARSLLSISGEALSLDGFRLLRIWRTFDRDSYEEENDLNLPKNFSHLVNMRYVGVTGEDGFEFGTSINRFWNLETLISDQAWPNSDASEIWNMPLIRHVEFTDLELSDPSLSNDGHDSNTFCFVFVTAFLNSWWGKIKYYLLTPSASSAAAPPSNDDANGDQNSVVVILENLQTLSRVRNFKFSEEVVKRIPNVKKLTVIYNSLDENSDYCFNNVERLANLESFGFFFFPAGPNLFQNLSFPYSLKKLTISQFHWEEMLEKIGALPLLEKLKLINGHMQERTWETKEDQFCKLKFLRIEGCNIECWRTESSHFPRLKHLVLCNLEKLKEIPSEVGEIPTLESIHLEFCITSCVTSARRILEDQQEFGNEDIQVRVLVKGSNRRSRRPATPNFQVIYIPN